MRQLVELHDLRSVFDALDTDILAIAQKETDPATLARVNELVGEGITVVADPEQTSVAAFKLFTSFLIDSEGVLQTAIPGTKAARARTDVIVREVAAVAGKDAPDVSYVDGVLKAPTAAGDEPAEGLALRTAWSHDRLAAGQPARLIVLPVIAPGWHVHADDAHGSQPFQLKLELPDGLTLSEPLVYPLSTSELGSDAAPHPAVFENDIPLNALSFEIGPELEVGTEAILRLDLTYQACGPDGCSAPDEKTVTLRLPVAPADARRGQLYGWQDW
jgi:hypothetical protein